MQFEHLNEFLDLAGTLSFTKSAANLHITQPTLSRHIADLERDMGSMLFTRTTNSVKLTRAGKLFYEKATLLVSSFEETIEDLHEQARHEVVTMRVGGSTVQPVVNRLFSRLSAQAVLRDLPIRFEYGRTRSLSGESPSIEGLDLLDSGEVDLIVVPLNKESEAFELYEFTPVCSEPLRLLASSKNPLASRSGLRLDDLLGSRLVTLAVYRRCPVIMSEAFIAAGYSPDLIKTNFIGNLLEIPEHLAALHDDEVVPLQEGFCDAFGFGQDGLGATVALDVADDRAAIAFYALWRKGSANPALDQTIELIEQVVGA